MDKYTKVLIVIIVLVYVNAFIFFFVSEKHLPFMPDSKVDIDNNINPVNSNTKNTVDLSSLVKDKGLSAEDLKKTQDGEVILEDKNIEGNMEFKNFTFNKEEGTIKTVVVKFRTMKIQPKDICYKETTYEDLRLMYKNMDPKTTGMIVKEKVDDMKGTIPDSLLDKIPSSAFTTDENDVNDSLKALEDQGNESYMVPVEQTRCEKRDPVYLASLFGKIEILKGDISISEYTITFEKIHRDENEMSFFDVEKKLYLPEEQGRYTIRFTIFDKLSSNKVTREEYVTI